MKGTLCVRCPRCDNSAVVAREIIALRKNLALVQYAQDRGL